jgi:hypothetical protein
LQRLVHRQGATGQIEQQGPEVWILGLFGSHVEVVCGNGSQHIPREEVRRHFFPLFVLNHKLKVLHLHEQIVQCLCVLGVQGHQRPVVRVQGEHLAAEFVLVDIHTPAGGLHFQHTGGVILFVGGQLATGIA